MSKSISTILYPRKDGATFDMSYYMATHMPLVEKNWKSYGLLKWHVTEFSEGPYTVQAILEWGSDDGFGNASTSDSGKTVFGDIPNFSSEQPLALNGSTKGTS